MNDERIRAIRERLANATPGPWKFFPDVGKTDFHGFAVHCSVSTPEWGKYGFDEPNARFVANAPADIAYLLERLEQVEASARTLARWVGAAEVAIRQVFPLTEEQRLRLRGQHEDVQSIVAQATGAEKRLYLDAERAAAASSPREDRE